MRVLCWRRCLSCGQFCEVVGGADHCPFAFYLVDAAEKELPEASGLLDVSKNGFDGVFLDTASALMFAFSESGAHGLNQLAAFFTAAWLACPLCCHIAANRARVDAPEISSRAGAVIGGDFVRHFARIGLDRMQLRRQGVLIREAGFVQQAENG